MQNVKAVRMAGSEQVGQITFRGRWCLQLLLGFFFLGFREEVVRDERFANGKRALLLGAPQSLDLGQFRTTKCAEVDPLDGPGDANEQKTRYAVVC